MVAADVSDHRFVHLVAADPDGPGVDDAAEREDRHLRRAAADIDDHGPGRLGHRQAGPDRRRHGLFDQIDPAGAGAGAGLMDGAPFDDGGARRDADDDLRGGEAAPVMHLADKVLDHFLGDIEVGNDAVAQRADGVQVTGCPAQHQLGFVAHG